MEGIDPTIKKIQKINLQTYKTFSEVCKANNLQYFAISGTSIGVHFWKGFVPWDDDMDIAMPIDDFEKFRKSIHKKLPKEYGFLELPELGGKVYQKNTTLIEAPYAYSPDHYYGAFIDIVPLIGLPDDEKERTDFISEIQRYIIEAAAVDRAPKLSIFTAQTTKTIQSTRQTLISRYPFGSTKYCTDLSCIKCPLYLTDGFLHPSSSKFEDTTIPISSQQKHDLAVAYGHLQKIIPPAERQLSHHNFYAFCDLDTPCEKYRQAFPKIHTPSWFQEITYKDHLFGISSAREAGLYKNLCKKLEAELAQERLHHQTEIATIRSSASFKVGNSIIKPFSKLKSLFTSKNQPK